MSWSRSGVGGGPRDRGDKADCNFGSRPRDKAAIPEVTGLGRKVRSRVCTSLGWAFDAGEKLTGEAGLEAAIWGPLSSLCPHPQVKLTRGRHVPTHGGNTVSCLLCAPETTDLAVTSPPTGTTPRGPLFPNSQQLLCPSSPGEPALRSHNTGVPAASPWSAHPLLLELQTPSLPAEWQPLWLFNSFWALCY